MRQQHYVACGHATSYESKLKKLAKLKENNAIQEQKLINIAYHQTIDQGKKHAASPYHTEQFDS